MEKLINELNERAIQLDIQGENATSMSSQLDSAASLECLVSGRLMELLRTMEIMIDLGHAESNLTNTLPVMQIKSVEVA